MKKIIYKLLTKLGVPLPTKKKKQNWDGYRICRLGAQIGYYKRDRPTFYRILDKKGNFVSSFTYEGYLEKWFDKEDYVITIGDIDKEIESLERELEALRKKIKSEQNSEIV